MSFSAARCLVIGAGVGGLSAAIELARQGVLVTVLERSPGVGGKMRPANIAGQLFDVGPTVLTMRWVFDGLFQRAGAVFSERLALTPLAVLARHAWDRGEVLDLFADRARSAAAIADFAGGREADGFTRFCARSEAIYRTLRHSFIEQPCSNPIALSRRVGMRHLPDLLRIAPFKTMDRALADYFRDPRLRQLFGRYATYCGSSPYLAPATLMLVAHVEQCGVWAVQGGMSALAESMLELAMQHGVQVRYSCDVSEIIIQESRAVGAVTASGEFIEADAIIANTDAQALATGELGDAARAAVKRIDARQRSLSAMTWAMRASVKGFSLLRHNVFFSSDYKAEFDQIIKRREPPDQPTVYICAQDRFDQDVSTPPPSERIFCLINAPARGDERQPDAGEMQSCQEKMLDQLRRSGLKLTYRPEEALSTSPQDFHHSYPATGGALYGRASHGWNASFQRPAATTPIRHLYLAGGSVHPGPGVPMAAQSGIIAARAAFEDLASTGRLHLATTAGGILTPLVTTA